MQTNFAFLSRFGVKFIEVAGAGLASALCAYCLGRMGEPPAPPPAPIVQVVPASDDAMRMAQDDHALLAALVRKETESQKKPEGAADAPSSASASKPVKPAPVTQGRRNQKPEPSATAETKPRAADPLSIQRPVTAANSVAKTAGQSTEALLRQEGFATATANSSDEERPLLARTQANSVLVPARERADLRRRAAPADARRRILAERHVASLSSAARNLQFIQGA